MNDAAFNGMTNTSVRLAQDEPGGLRMKPKRIKFNGKMADARRFMGVPPIYHRG